MKSKLLIFIIIIAIMLPLFAIPALASSRLVKITRPDGNEVVTKETFFICGSEITDDITIELEYKDQESGKFKPLLTTEGESSYKVEKGSYFGKNFKLRYKGQNEIKITAYSKLTKDDPQYFTITYAEEKKDDNWFTSTITDIGDSLKNWLEK